MSNYRHLFEDALRERQEEREAEREAEHAKARRMLAEQKREREELEAEDARWELEKTQRRLNGFLKILEEKAEIERQARKDLQENAVASLQAKYSQHDLNQLRARNMVR